jgi:hypothetical protein
MSKIKNNGADSGNSALQVESILKILRYIQNYISAYFKLLLYNFK